VLRLAIVLLVLASGGCGGRLVVRSVVTLPAELPLHVFPELGIVPGADADDDALATALAAHLRASTPSRVEVIDETSLEQRRADGRIGPAAGIVRVRTSLAESSRPGFEVVPETVCGAYGCYTEQRRVVVDVPVVLGRLVLRVIEAREERVLQELVLEEREEGSDPIAMRLRVLDRLRARALAAVGPRRSEVEVELALVDDPALRGALDALRAGRAAEAREALHQLASGPAFERRSTEDRARILFDLGQAQRLEARSSADPDAGLARAAETIREAIRTQPEALYARALEQLTAERDARARLRAVQDAAEHNFALDRSPTLPDVPPGYR
jgi:hypothetical protein